MTEETTPKLYCYIHPDRETLLRCNRCEQPICSQCAVLTPTGYRCKNCVRGQQKIFDTAQSTDFIAAGGISLVLSFVGSLLVLSLAPLLFGGGIGGILGLIYRGLYTVLVTSSVYYRLGGIDIR